MPLFIHRLKPSHGLMGAVQAAIDALVGLVEFLFEIAFDISPAGNVGQKIHFASMEEGGGSAKTPACR
uniref:hypothetical protein n=1 Tax=Pseudomonas asiatica TaxID=2219225 RepID=UPI00294FEF8B|nr:hypothetical protein [Pseudomonas asiatica]